MLHKTNKLIENLNDPLKFMDSEVMGDFNNNENFQNNDDHNVYKARGVAKNERQYHHNAMDSMPVNKGGMAGTTSGNNVYADKIENFVKTTLSKLNNLLRNSWKKFFKIIS